MLWIFCAFYRIESGATFRQHLPWLRSWAHNDMHGGLAGRELLDVAWDAQSHIEHAKLWQEHVTVFMLDYAIFLTDLTTLG